MRVTRFTAQQLSSLYRFSPKIVAVFFDTTVSTLRRQEREGRFKDNKGEPLLPLRVSNQRQYSLDLMRQMAHSLRRENLLSNYQLKVILNRIDAFAIPVRRKKK